MKVYYDESEDELFINNFLVKLGDLNFSSFDDKGNELFGTYIDSYWCRNTYDEHGNSLSFHCSPLYMGTDKTFWFEYTRDDKGNILSYSDSDGRTLN